MVSPTDSATEPVFHWSLSRSLPGVIRSSPDTKSALHLAATRTLSSFEPPNSGGEDVSIASGDFKFEQAELAQVLNLYAAVSGRSMICAGTCPRSSHFYQSDSHDVRRDSAGAGHGACAAGSHRRCSWHPIRQGCGREASPLGITAGVLEREWQKLPDSSSYLTLTVQLKISRTPRPPRCSNRSRASWQIPSWLSVRRVAPDCHPRERCRNWPTPSSPAMTIAFSSCAITRPMCGGCCRCWRNSNSSRIRRRQGQPLRIKSAERGRGARLFCNGDQVDQAAVEWQ